MDTGLLLRRRVLEGEGAVSMCQALLNKTRVWIERVASDDNISDLPSREEYELLADLGARWRCPVIAQIMVDNSPIGADGPVAACD